jgi:hypothetical protein
MKTPMQELIEKLAIKSGDSSFHAIAFYHDNDEIIKEALKKEKEHLKTAFESGWNWNFSSEKYYNETYNENK